MRWIVTLGMLVLAGLAYLVYEFHHVSEPSTVVSQPSASTGKPTVAVPPAVPAPAVHVPSSRSSPSAPPPAPTPAPAVPGPAPDRFPHQDDAMLVAKSNAGPIARREAIEWLGLYGSHEILFQLRDLALADADPEIRRMAREVAEKMESRFTAIPTPEP